MSNQRAHGIGALAAALRRPVAWVRRGDVTRPFAAEVAGQQWLLQLGDFPAAPLYTLIVDGEEIGSFDTWPEAWGRPTP
jgi:hypothetical protein